MASIVLITGANGFIGSYATLLFESLGHRVVPVDIGPRSRDLSLLPIKPSTIKLDITDFKRLHKLCRKMKVTHIVHTAHPNKSENPEVLDFSLRTMRNILETARELDVQRVVFASSGTIYGRLGKDPGSLLGEDEPMALYPTFLSRSSKILGEWLGDFYALHRSVSFVALRLSSVYGPGQADGIGAAIKEGILGRECRPYLNQIPDDLIYVKDAMQAFGLACFFEQSESRVYNIASGRGYVEEDLERVMREHLPEVPFEIGEPLDFAAVADNRRSHILDITLAREELGFSPQFDLDSGIDAIAAWVRREKRHLR
ncbi:MAG: NAD(P)-dependent oxidoreductase [Candidatus Binatia bacterium]